MRIAISGSHGTGKSTLIDVLSHALRGFVKVEEPYHLLAAEGHVFADRPDLDDFERLLERSSMLLRDQQLTDAVFDRCPADYLAYIVALGRPSSQSLATTVRDVQDALRTLDLVIHVPVETPDRIPDAAGPLRLRRRVDALLHEMLVDDDWGFAVPALAVQGTPEQRARQVESHLVGTYHLDLQR
jgi:adenylate kinase family enzyme